MISHFDGVSITVLGPYKNSESAVAGFLHVIDLESPCHGAALDLK